MKKSIYIALLVIFNISHGASSAYDDQASSAEEHLEKERRLSVLSRLDKVAELLKKDPNNDSLQEKKLVLVQDFNELLSSPATVAKQKREEELCEKRFFEVADRLDVLVELLKKDPENHSLQTEQLQLSEELSQLANRPAAVEERRKIAESDASMAKLKKQFLEFDKRQKAANDALSDSELVENIQRKFSESIHSFSEERCTKRKKGSKELSSDLDLPLSSALFWHLTKYQNMYYTSREMLYLINVMSEDIATGRTLDPDDGNTILHLACKYANCFPSKKSTFEALVTKCLSCLIIENNNRKIPSDLILGKLAPSAVKDMVCSKTFELAKNGRSDLIDSRYYFH